MKYKYKIIKDTLYHEDIGLFDTFSVEVFVEDKDCVPIAKVSDVSTSLDETVKFVKRLEELQLPVEFLQQALSDFLNEACLFE